MPVTLQPFFAHTDVFKHTSFPLTIEAWNLLLGRVRSLPVKKKFFKPVYECLFWLFFHPHSCNTLVEAAACINKINKIVSTPQPKQHVNLKLEIK